MSAPRYKTTKWHGLDNYECQVCPFKTLDRGEMVVHVRRRHPTAAESGSGAETHPLAAVPFASDEAAELAVASGLGPRDFKHRTPTGRTGYVLDDVRRIAASAATDVPEED